MAHQIKIDKETLFDLYINQGKSLIEISRIYECSDNTIRAWLIRHRIPRRDLSAARVSAIKHGKLPQFASYEINEKFFKNWSTGMAWVLGLLFTDGYFLDQKGHRAVRLALIDMDTLEKVKKLLGYTGPIRKRAQSYDKKQNIFLLEFHRKEMMDDLSTLGLTQRKSLTMQFPLVPENYRRHFIRGCWDGDGGFSANLMSPMGHYTCGSKEFIEKIVYELYQAGIVRRQIDRATREERSFLREKYSLGPYPLTIYKRKNKNAYDIRITGKENLQALSHYFYDDLDGQFFMSSKRKKLMQILESSIIK